MEEDLSKDSNEVLIQRIVVLRLENTRLEELRKKLLEEHDMLQRQKQIRIELERQAALRRKELQRKLDEWRRKEKEKIDTETMMQNKFFTTNYKIDKVDKVDKVSIIRIGDIPFPSERWIQSQIGKMGCRKVYKLYALRWHPDSFMNKLGKNLEDGVNILKSVTAAFQLISKLTGK